MLKGGLRDTFDFVRENARWLGAGFLLLLFSTFGQTLLIGLAGADVRAKFGLTGGGFGALYMAATIATAITLPWLGRTLDFMPTTTIVRFTMLGLAAGCALLPLAPNVALLGVAIYLIRLFGQGMLTQLAYTETSRWFIANRGRALSLVNPGLQAGIAVFPVLFVLAHEWGGATAPWLAGAAVVLALGLPVLLWLLSVERTPQATTLETTHKSRLPRDWSRAEALADPVFYLLLFATMALPFISTVVFFHQSHLVELRHYDKLVFAGSFPVMALTTIVFGFVSGALVDRFRSPRLLPFMMIPMGAATFALAWLDQTWVVYTFMLMLGVSSGFLNTLYGSIWPEVYGSANLGGIRAMSMSAMVLATAGGPGLAGFLIDAGVAISDQLVGLGIWCVLGFFAMIWVAHAVEKRNSVQE